MLRENTPAASSAAARRPSARDTSAAATRGQARAKRAAAAYDLPRNPFVADFVGSANLVRGRHRHDLGGDGTVVLETSAGTLVHGTAYGRRAGADALFSVRTVHLRLARERPPTGLNVWAARVRRRVFQGDFTQYPLDWEDRELVVRATAADSLADGDDAYVSVDPRHCVLLED